jgi:hypothetical protein
VGTTVTHKRVQTTNRPTPFESATKEKLVKVTPENVVIEVTVTMKMNGQDRTMPANETTIPAKIEKNQAGLPNQAVANKPNVLDNKVGKETLEVKGKKVEVQTYTIKAEIIEEEEKFTAQIKTWFSAEVPGGLVQSEMTVAAPKMRDKTTLVDYMAAK